MFPRLTIDEDWDDSVALAHESERKHIEAAMTPLVGVDVSVFAAGFSVAEFAREIGTRKRYRRVVAVGDGPIPKSFALLLHNGVMMVGTTRSRRVDLLQILNRPFDSEMLRHSSNPYWSTVAMRMRAFAIAKRLVIVDWRLPAIVSPLDDRWRRYWADQPPPFHTAYQD